MVVILKRNAEHEKVNALMRQFEDLGLKTNLVEGTETNIIGLIGDTSKVDEQMVLANSVVESVRRVSEPYKAANRKFHADDTVVDIHGAKIGGGNFGVMSGPCSVESEEQIIEVAQRVKAAGANFLRGGAFKPRTSPYSFQGLKAEGIELLLAAKKATGLPIVTEIMDIRHLDLFSDVDVIQVGARNMQNFEMLKQLGHCNKPILLKRGLANTIEEFLMSAEYIMAGGNTNIILCERGIRTFETYTRNTLDISAVPVIKHLSHLPIIIDPSHAAGIPWLVEPLAKAAVAVGADGLMIEVHNCPAKALSDGAQSLTPDQFDGVMQSVKHLLDVEGKKILPANC
ncbi:MAG TPA: 3-deoxy-7-phosphoheptulonate synthase [Firmicutes bacterium]|nr:3-deoxy-7-phosphoheptulonate synthase [Bacillota bacterium]